MTDRSHDLPTESNDLPTGSDYLPTLMVPCPAPADGCGGTLGLVEPAGFFLSEIDHNPKYKLKLFEKA